MSLFYDHLIDLKEIEATLDKFALKPKDRAKLLKVLDETLHHELFTHFLNILPVHAHGNFLTQVKERPYHGDILIFIRQYHPHVDHDISRIGTETTRRFLDSIHDSVVQ